jgi:hypothetical protein
MQNVNVLFYLISLVLYVHISLFHFHSVISNQPVSQEVLDFRAGREDSAEASSCTRKILQVLIENFFSDWAQRVEYQKQEEKFFQSRKKTFKKQPKFLYYQIASS